MIAKATKRKNISVYQDFLRFYIVAICSIFDRLLNSPFPPSYHGFKRVLSLSLYSSCSFKAEAILCLRRSFMKHKRVMM